MVLQKHRSGSIYIAKWIWDLKALCLGHSWGSRLSHIVTSFTVTTELNLWIYHCLKSWHLKHVSGAERRGKGLCIEVDQNCWEIGVTFPYMKFVYLKLRWTRVNFKWLVVLNSSFLKRLLKTWSCKVGVVEPNMLLGTLSNVLAKLEPYLIRSCPNGLDASIVWVCQRIWFRNRKHMQSF